MATPCSDCARAREGPGWAMFNPACLWCGARLVGRLRNLPRRAGEIQARQERVLQDWVAYGHDRQALLALSHEELPVAPLACEPPDQTKPRSAKKKSSSVSATG